ncbi:thioredoxin [Candidatus Dojkabacteria bacterium]|nr:thioredoxin [Candidatus Dojkabacteria bacterium]
MAKVLTDDKFQEEVLDSSKPVLVDFWAEWCMPCQMLTPIIEELSDEMGDKVSIGKLNVDENRETAAKYQVMSIPTVALFKDGQIVKQFVGVQPKEVYKQAIEEAAEGE